MDTEAQRLMNIDAQRLMNTEAQRLVDTETQLLVHIELGSRNGEISQLASCVDGHLNRC